MFVGGKTRWAWLCDVLGMAPHLCLLVPGPFGDVSPLRDKPTPKLVRGSRGEVGRVLECGPRGGPGCASHRGIQRDRGLGVTQLGKPEVQKKADRCFGSASGEAAALG